MNCFKHRDVPAVGLCKSCGKGLCPDCVAELVNGLACKGACEERVNRINRMMDGNSHVMNAARRLNTTSGMFLAFFGIAFLVFAVWSFFEASSPSFIPYFLGVIAVFMLSIGLLKLGRSQQYPRLDEQEKPK
jgi:hypothetical protein